MFFSVVSFISSVVGSICGIGGGVIIKPVLDAINAGNIDIISFLSGCTVLSMSCYSVIRTFLMGNKSIDPQRGTLLAIGATLGGILGKQLFRAITTSAPNSDITQIIQSFILLILLIGTLTYTFRKKYIHAQQIHKSLPCLIIGLNLGCLSSFLGIGGGPINLVVLHYFFSMDTKTAAANSLYIILFSQAASLISTIMTGTTPEFELISLVQMIGGGILGGICGRQISKRISNATVDKLFILVTCVILLICLRNILSCLSF